MTRRPKIITGIIVLIIAFLCSRIFYLLVLGVHFETDPLNYYCQYLDPQLLRTDLLRSVFYMHFQPPAFNLFLGIILKLFPTNFAQAFQGIYLASGLAFSIVLFLLLIEMGVKYSLALGLTVAHTIFPTTILYESWLFYGYPIALLLCASAYFLLLFLRRFQSRYGLLFFSTIALISCIHAMYGLAWFVFILAALWKICQSRRATISRCALAPFAILLLLAIKQFFLFGVFTTGAAYTGPNLAYRIALKGNVPQAVRDAAIQSGQVPPFFFEYPLLPLTHFKDSIPPPAPTGIPALDQTTKSTGATNFNHPGYLAVGQAYMRGVLAFTCHHPFYFFRTFFTIGPYFEPASDYAQIEQNQSGPLADFIRTVNHITCGQFLENRPGWLLVVVLPILLTYGLAKIFRDPQHRDPRWTALAYMLFNIFYTSLLTLCLTWGDWNRYRFNIDAFYIVLLGMLFTVIARTYTSGTITRAKTPADQPVESNA